MNETQVADMNTYNLIKEDPIALLKLIDKHVKIVIIKNCIFVGFVHSVDPVTHSIILSVADGDIFKPTFIPGHAILEVIEEPAMADARPLRKQVTKDSEEKISTKKEKLLAWFKNNLLPVTESDGKILIGSVTVLPPYSDSDVCTNNPIIAMQIKKLMDMMPEN